MTAKPLTSSSPINQSTDTESMEMKDGHSVDDNVDSGVDDQDSATSSDEIDPNEKHDLIDDTNSEPTTIITTAIDDVVVAVADLNESIENIDENGDALNVTQPLPIDDPISDEMADEIRYKNLKIIYGGRDILDFCGNIANKSWYIQYTYLPEKNISMCLANRSQYHRLSVGWDPKGAKLDTCRKCAFQYPVKVPDFQAKPTAAALNTAAHTTTTFDAINAVDPNEHVYSSGSHISNNPTAHANFNQMSSMFNANNPKSMNMFNMNSSTNNNNNCNNSNNGYQPLYPNQYSGNNITMNSSNGTISNNNNNPMSGAAITSKQANYGFQYNNANSNLNGFMNNFMNGNTNIAAASAAVTATNAATINNNNMWSNKQQMYPMNRQNLNNSNNMNNTNNINAGNYGKMPYKMYSHFY